MSDDLRERIENHIKGFSVGDYINTLIYPDSEIEGEIIAIEGNLAVVKTEYGTFRSPLSLARLADKKS